MDNVLIVDDNQVLIKLITTKLKKYADRFNAITAQNGEEAIDILNNTEISLMVTDLNMPKVDGMQLLIYKNQHYPEIPCIIMTAHSTAKIKKRLQQEVINYIEKKESNYIDELVEAIFNALEKDIPVGTLQGISIANFLQMIEMEQKTCLFEINAPDKPKGVFYFEDGVLYDAVYGSERGVDAALKMIQLDSLKINFRKHPDKALKRRINVDLIALIMEAMRLKDESSEQGDETNKDTIESCVATHDETGENDLQSCITESIFNEIKGLKGYRAVGLIQFNGEILASDAVDNQIDFNDLNHTFNDFFIALDEIHQRIGFTPIQESFSISDSGLIVILSAQLHSGDPIFIIAIFESGANRGMIKLTMKNITNQIRKNENMA